MFNNKENWFKEKEKIFYLLKNMNTSSKIECFEGGIRVKIRKGNFKNINKLLVSNDVSVENIHCSETSLENYFFRCNGRR